MEDGGDDTEEGGPVTIAHTHGLKGGDEGVPVSDVIDGGVTHAARPVQEGEPLRPSLNVKGSPHGWVGACEELVEDVVVALTLGLSDTA